MNIDKFLESLTDGELNELAVKLKSRNKSKLSTLNTRTPVLTWLNQNSNVMSARLRSTLKYEWQNSTEYIELFNAKDLCQYRNIGKYSYNEFLRLRGY
jgi:hypothetical protein